MMQAVQTFAVDEFVKKHELMLSWYRARIARNMQFIWGLSRAVSCWPR
jgi:hypothetical protein